MTDKMVKFKTLIESLGEGYEKAFDKLDRKAEDLGDIVIKYIKDSILPEDKYLETNKSVYLHRIIAYEEKVSSKVPVKGKPWEPTLDTDIGDLIDASAPPMSVEGVIWTMYQKGNIKTIRDLIAKPYGYFQAKANCKPKEWEETKKFLGKYGFKLYKKGNVIKKD